MLQPSRRSPLSDQIDYRNLMHRAMQGLMAEVLRGVTETGLPGKHHFFITFDTTHSGVDMSPALKARFPKEMTIVMQEWFADLAVMSDRFAVTLNFGNVAEPLVIPFDSVRAFVDPSVEFGLRFEPVAADPKPVARPEPASRDRKKPAAESAVVSLDAFRKT
jgi:uncharacterized protein